MILIASQYSFLMRLVLILMSVTFKYCTMKCVNIWEFYIMQKTNLIQFIHAQGYEMTNR